MLYEALQQVANAIEKTTGKKVTRVLVGRRVTDALDRERAPLIWTELGRMRTGHGSFDIVEKPRESEDVHFEVK
jgi:hypothetical protein